jgi:hypothetical protein
MRKYKLVLVGNTPGIRRMSDGMVAHFPYKEATKS